MLCVCVCVCVWSGDGGFYIHLQSGHLVGIVHLWTQAMEF
jgi:hypothetical protein